MVVCLQECTIWVRQLVVRMFDCQPKGHRFDSLAWHRFEKTLKFWRRVWASPKLCTPERTTLWPRILRLSHHSFIILLSSSWLQWSGLLMVITTPNGAEGLIAPHTYYTKTCYIIFILLYFNVWQETYFNFQDKNFFISISCFVTIISFFQSCVSR